jgi:inhibitor of cysteine peptidase
MNRIVAVVGLLLLTLGLMSLSGCSASAAAKVPIDVGCEEFQKQAGSASISRKATLGVGETLMVNLCSNPSTGFKWEKASIADGAVLEEVGQEYVEPSANVVGGAGKERWTFKALKKGLTTVSMKYSRPWEGGEKGVWDFTLQVEVK